MSNTGDADDLIHAVNIATRAKVLRSWRKKPELQELAYINRYLKKTIQDSKPFAILSQQWVANLL